MLANTTLEIPDWWTHPYMNIILAMSVEKKMLKGFVYIILWRIGLAKKMLVVNNNKDCKQDLVFLSMEGLSNNFKY